MAAHEDTTSTRIHDGLMRPFKAWTIVMTIPGKTQRSRVRIVSGKLLGVMFMRGIVHHFRVAGEDGVLYLCPPYWLSSEHEARATWSVTRDAEMFQMFCELCGHDAKKARVIVDTVNAAPDDLPRGELQARVEQALVQDCGA